jgi:hypothetical protein
MGRNPQNVRAVDSFDHGDTIWSQHLDVDRSGTVECYLDLGDRGVAAQYRHIGQHHIPTAEGHPG